MSRFPTYPQPADGDSALMRADEPSHIHVMRPSLRNQGVEPRRSTDCCARSHDSSELNEE